MIYQLFCRCVLAAFFIAAYTTPSVWAKNASSGLQMPGKHTQADSMAGQFILRTENDPNNPFAARLYGKGLTAGRVVFYTNDGAGARTKFVALLAQGARERGDLPCGDVLRVFYAGFELAEFEAHSSGTQRRNWKYHPGTVATAPVYKVITSIDATPDVFNVVGHGLVSGDLVAFHTRGGDATLPGIFPVNSLNLADLTTHQSYMVWRVDDDNFKLLAQLAGETPDEGEAFTLTTAAANVDRIFCYKADTFYFDEDQGRPLLFPNLDFTFSGLSYLEVELPAHLSNGEDEPSRLKVIMNGKQVYGITSAAGNVVIDTGVTTAEPNPALVAVDALVNDAKLPLTRLHGDTFVAWRDRADALINWVGGNDNPAGRSSFSLTNMTFDVGLQKLTHGGAGGNGYAFTEQFTAVYPSIEVRYLGHAVSIYFASTNVPGETTQQGARVTNGILYFVDGTTFHEIAPVAVGDTVRIAYENGLCNVYRNSIPMPLVNVSQEQSYTTYYCKILIPTPGGSVDRILIAPSGTASTPRQVKRFTGGFVAIEPTPVAALFETMTHLTAAAWADVDGQIRVATEPDRTPCHTFIYDPTDVNSSSNVHKITLRRRDSKYAYNYWRFVFRDDDDVILSRKYTSVDRPERRTAQGGRLNDAGLLQYGVMSQSQVERLGEVRARLETDLDIGFTVEAFLDSLSVVRGSYVEVVDQPNGYTQASPALCVVNDIRLALGGDVETVVYDLQIITASHYSDTDHGQVTPAGGGKASGVITPPQVAAGLTLTESEEPMPDGRYISSVSGTVTFGDGFNQHARLYRKVLAERYGEVTYDNGTNVFTVTDGNVPPTDVPLALGAPGLTLPEGASIDTEYWAVEAGTGVFKLSLTEGGAAAVFTTNGSSLGIYASAPWQDTGVQVLPNDDGEAGFEIIPAVRSLTVVRAVTRSAAQASLSFAIHTTEAVDVIGDVSPPLPPATAALEYDGVRLRLSWDGSTTFGVSGYVIKDEADRFIAQTSAHNLSYVQTAQADRVTRRIYAVSSSGVLSSTYAVVTWVKPPATGWINATGVTVNADNSLTKTAATGWDNAGAALNHALLTDRRPILLSAAPDRNDTAQVFGITRTAAPDGLTDFEYAIHFKADGTLELYYNNGADTLALGTYAAGERFAIEYVPNLTPGEVSLVRVLRRTFKSGVETWVPIGLFTEAGREFLGYIGVAIYASGATSSLDIRAEGVLVPAVGTNPAAAQNLTNATYSAGTLTSTGGTGWGSSGASFTGLSAGQDGGWRFTFSGYGAIGLATSDPDQTADSIPLNLRIYDDFEAEIYQGSTMVVTGLFINPTAEVFIGREGGVPVIRVNGAVVYTYLTAPTSLKEDALILDAALRDDIAPGSLVTDIRLHGAYTALLDPDSKVATVTVDMRSTARVGENVVADIPKFAIASPQSGEVLLYDANGQVVNARAARRLAQRLTDATTGSTSSENVWTYSMPANLFAEDGDTVVFEFAVFLANNANGKYVGVRVNATDVAFEDVSAGQNAHAIIRGSAVRVSSSALRVAGTIVFNEGAAYPFAKYAEVGSLTFTNAYDLAFRARTPGLAGDVTLRYATVDWIPAA